MEPCPVLLIWAPYLARVDGQKTASVALSTWTNKNTGMAGFRSLVLYLLNLAV